LGYDGSSARVCFERKRDHPPRCHIPTRYVVPHSEQEETMDPGFFAATPGRVAAFVAVTMGLMGALIGGAAVVRARRGIGPGKGRRGAIVALVIGPAGVIIGGLVVVTARGGLGTGHGMGGGIVAVLVGLTGMALGGLALARRRSSG
jgi:hypothetical protein